MCLSDSPTPCRALVVSPDSGASRQISDALQEYALSVDVGVDISAASEQFSSRKYEAVLLDLSLGDDVLSCLREIRCSASNRLAVTFALTSGKDDTVLAQKRGFGFVLERPLTPESIRDTLRVSYGLMVRERRRYFRCSIVVPVLLNGKAALETRTINVSEGGLAVSNSPPLEPGSKATVEFTLSDPPLLIRANARVCWSNDKGEAGLSFVHLPFDMTSALQQWLAVKLEEQLPGNVAGRIRNHVWLRRRK
jgi:hypothetical protein